MQAWGGGEDSLGDMLHDALAGSLPLGRGFRAEPVRGQGVDVIAQQGAEVVSLGQHVGVEPHCRGGPVRHTGASLHRHAQLRPSLWSAG